MRWDGQITQKSRIQVEVGWYSKWLWGGMGKPLLEVSYSFDYYGQTTRRSLVFKWLWGGMGKPLLEVSYSSDYEVGWALLELVFKWLLGGMGKPLLVSYSGGSEISYSWLWGGMGKPLLEVSYSSDYEVGWANHS